MVLFAAGTLSLANAAPANIWASVQFSKSEVMAGEPLMATITVYTSTWFTTPPQFNEIQVPEAIMVEYPQRTGSTMKKIGNKSYPAIEKKYVVYPFRVGRNSLPSLTIVVESPDEGDYRGKRRVVASPERAFSVLAPPAGTVGETWLTASSLTARNEWDKSLEQLSQGDVLQRRITIRAEGSLAALIPPLDPPAGDFGKTYSRQASLENIQSQTGFTGTRTENWTYLMEAAGDFTIPAITLRWFNYRTDQQMTTEISGYEINVAENPDQAFLLTMQDSLQALLEGGSDVPREPFQWMGLNWWQLTIVILTIFGLGVLSYRWLRRYSSNRHKRKLEAMDSEETYYRKFVDAGREGDPGKVLAALFRWYDRFRKPGDPPGLKGWMTRVGDDRLIGSYQQLEQVVFAGADPREWQGNEMAHRIAEIRKRKIKTSSKVHIRRLTKLNPFVPESEKDKQ